MGIPSYFSQLVKNYSEVIKQYENLNKKVNNFYLDCNSIVYDSVRTIEIVDENFEDTLLRIICEKIEEYIQIINPNQNIFIAFDGVAPVAKLEQQRNRRYKSNFMAKINEHFNKKQTWKLASITPGTNFMKKLSLHINNHFKNNKNKFTATNIIISTSDEPGEGEHKLYEYIRNNPEEHTNQITVVYGIDADLIMLCLNHLPLCKQLYLYRETPYFIKSLCKELEPEKCYLLDIPKLANLILKRMNNYKEVNFIHEKNKLYDYIFLCFILGNDFIPHSPYINIRTSGIDILMNTYSSLFKNSNKNLTNGKEIYWTNFRKLVEDIAKNEETYFQDEYKIRNKWEKRNFPQKTYDEKMSKLDHIPIKNRDIEKLINPFEDGWKQRYYKHLFGFDYNQKYVKKVCINYLEALEWTLKYYCEDCYDWRWCYQYDYTPLFSDLIKYIPLFDSPFFEKKPKLPIHPDVQLAYVLPKDYHFLIKDNLREKLEKECSEYYPDKLNFSWSFCKYFWECHVDLPHINIKKLEQIIF
jgi:5'-3' exoribonuclease 1